MSLIARLAAAGLGAGILFAGAGSALAAPAEDTDATSTESSSADAAPTDSTDAAPSDAAPTDSAEAGPTGGPAGGPAPTYVLEGVGVPFSDPSLGVPKVLEAGILPFGLLADAAGQGGSTASPQGAQNGPGSTEA